MFIDKFINLYAIIFYCQGSDYVSKPINLSKDSLTLFCMDLLLINKAYKNQVNTIDDTAKDFSKKFEDYCKYNDDELSNKMLEIAKISVEYSVGVSSIITMYHTLEQYIKIEYNIISKNKESIIEKLSDVCVKYNYIVNDNSYYDIVEKYRNMTNSLKHGKIKKSFKNQYPELINSDDSLGTLLNNTFNITESVVDECCFGLVSFVEEMYSYFENIGI